MKILHVATQVSGGAGRSALRLHQGLLRLGVDSQMLVLRPPTDAGVTEFKFASEFAPRVRRYLRRHLHRRRGEAIRQAPQPRFEEFSLDTSSSVGRDLVAQLPPDAIINLHWVAGFVNYAEFFPLLGRRKVFWTLHDMNPFTGGCHFDNRCGRFVESCGQCPQLGSATPNDLSRQIWQRKNESLQGLGSKQLEIVTPSHWLAEESRQSSLFKGRPTTVIPYGIDTDTFAPVDRVAARTALGLPLQAKIVLFVAAALDSPRKGAQDLLHAIRQVKTEQLFLASVGASNPPEIPGVGGKHFGVVRSDETLAQIYSAADVFVIPSLADNLPNTVMEAMACGTPVVGYAAGGIPELTDAHGTGVCVPTGDPAALAAAIERMLVDTEFRNGCAQRCRPIVLAKYTLTEQARNYTKLYATSVAP